MRGISAFVVILLHAGIAVHNRTTPAVGALQADLDFAVRFFMVTAFYWELRAEQSGRLRWAEWLARRGSRLFIPFAFWSAVYFALHATKLGLHHQAAEIPSLWADPVALVLSGGTSVALYFLPVLFMGQVLTRLLSGLLRRSPLPILALGFGVALVVEEFCHLRGYAYHMDGTGGPSDPVLRFFVELVEEALSCSPLVFCAGFLCRYLPEPDARRGGLQLALGLLLMILAPVVSLPYCVLQVVLGLGPFLTAWGISGLSPARVMASVVGRYSFGVYLVHQVFLELFQLFISPAAPVGLAGVLGLTVIVYAASMLTVGLAERCGTVARQVFGLK